MSAAGCALVACSTVLPAVGFLYRPVDRPPSGFLDRSESRNAILKSLLDTVNFKLKLFEFIVDINESSSAAEPSHSIRISSMYRNQADT